MSEVLQFLYDILDALNILILPSLIAADERIDMEAWGLEVRHFSGGLPRVHDPKVVISGLPTEKK